MRAEHRRRFRRATSWTFGFLLLASCGETRLVGDADETDAGEGDVLEVPGDVDHDDTGDVIEDTIILPDVEAFPPVTEVPGCGNTVLDPGEECDDGNRVNGDECDWLCRLGPGDPPPAPDPSVPDVEGSGETTSFPDAEMAGSDPDTQLPFLWNGSTFATVYDTSLADDDAYRLVFRRLDRAGVPVGSPWTYTGPVRASGYDLAWTGAGYGLFLGRRGEGVFYQRLDEEGKPVGGLVCIVDHPLAERPSAAWADGSFVVAWRLTVRPRPYTGGWIQIRRFDTAGVPLGGTVTVDLRAVWDPRVAAQDGSVGLVVTSQPDPDVLEFGARFFRFDAALAEVATEGMLFRPAGGGILSSWERRYVVAFELRRSPESPAELCVARFDHAGELEDPPVCSLFSPSGNGSAKGDPAAGAGGLAVMALGSVYSEPMAMDIPHLYFLRFDAAGVLVGSPHDVVEVDPMRPPRIDSANVAWDGEGFGVLYEWAGHADGDLHFTRFLPIP